MTENPFEKPASQLVDEKQYIFSEVKRPPLLWLVCLSIFLTSGSAWRLQSAIGDPDIKRLALLAVGIATFGLMFAIFGLHKVSIALARIFFSAVISIGLYQVYLGLLNGRVLPASLLVGVALPAWALFYICTPSFSERASKYRKFKEQNLMRQTALGKL